MYHLRQYNVIEIKWDWRYSWFRWWVHDGCKWRPLSFMTTLYSHFVTSISCIQRKIISLKDWSVLVLSPCSFLQLGYTLARSLYDIFDGIFEDPPQKNCPGLKYIRTLIIFSVNSEVAHSWILRPLKILSQFTSISNKWHLWNFWDHLKNSVPVANYIIVIFEIP